MGRRDWGLGASVLFWDQGLGLSIYAFFWEAISRIPWHFGIQRWHLQFQISPIRCFVLHDFCGFAEHQA